MPAERFNRDLTLWLLYERSLATGPIIKHFVSLPNDVTITVQELANERRTVFRSGEPVCVTWPVEAGIFLDR